MRRHAMKLATAILAMLAATGPARAAITDPAGDFIPSYVGPHNADLDVLSASAIYDGSFFRLGATLAGTIGTPGGLYVWGFDRGQGTARFGTIATGVLFDSVVTLTTDGTAAVRDLLSNIGTTLPAGDVRISGSQFQIDVPAALLPSAGLQPGDYTVNLWPRLGAGNNNQIADFAPDNSNFRVAAPEPASLGLFAVGLAALGLRRRVSSGRSSAR
jgi:hypothetical protein